MGAPWLIYKGRRLQSFTLAQADNNRCWPKLPDEPNLAFALLVVRAANLSLPHIAAHLDNNDILYDR